MPGVHETCHTGVTHVNETCHTSVTHVNETCGARVMSHKCHGFNACRQPPLNTPCLKETDPTARFILVAAAAPRTAATSATSATPHPHTSQMPVCVEDLHV